MADEQEQAEAASKHRDTMARLQTLRSDVTADITEVIDRYFDLIPNDLVYERDDRGYIRDDLRRIQSRIDETINSL